MHKGFTILELLVVLVIISLATAFLAPRLLSPNRHLQLKTTVNKMAGALRYTSNMATTAQKSMAVFIDIRKNKLWVAPAADSDESVVLDNTEKHRDGLSNYNYPEDIVFFQEYSVVENSSPDGLVVYFFSDGSCSGGNLVFGYHEGPKYNIAIDFITSIITVERYG